MNLTIEQEMHQAVTDHSKGNLQEAERIYKKVLKIVPTHVDANHNLGVLLVSCLQSYNALPFLRSAYEGNLKVEQFWISYINALINLDKLDKARELITKASDAGIYSKTFDLLSERTLTPAKLFTNGKFFQAQDGDYLNFLKALHVNIYEGYFEIGTRTGASLVLSQSPSISIDPFFQLEHFPVGKKDFCLMFQETSDNFFKNTLPKMSGLKCQLAFIDGMHLFECALRDFINLAKIASKDALFLFHDPIPWTFKMATRNFETLDRKDAWTGDIWKLVPILIDAGMKNNINLLTSGPSGLLAVLNPSKKIIEEIEKNYDKICTQWLNVELNETNLLNFYKTGVFVKPEVYLQSLEKISFGNRVKTISREWVSH